MFSNSQKASAFLFCIRNNNIGIFPCPPLQLQNPIIPAITNATPLDNTVKNYVTTKRGHKYYYIPNCTKAIPIKEKNRVYLTAQEVKDGAYSPGFSC